MLIGFLGAPSSGKTTTALGLAYNLKLQGLPVEYLPEPARFVIREFGHNNQDEILRRELNNVELAKNYPDTLWVTDGGAYMGQFYGGRLVQSANYYDYIVHCPTLFNAGPDNGRIHNSEFSQSIGPKMAAFAETQQNILTFNPKNKDELVRLTNIIKNKFTGD